MQHVSITTAFLCEISFLMLHSTTVLQNSIDQKIEDAVEHEYFVVSLYQMDIERVRYSLARYFRTRLLKIERNLEYILSNIDVMDRLSMSEKEFATKIQRLNDRHFEENVSNRFEHVDAREYYESTENRLRNAQPPEKVIVFVLFCCCIVGCSGTCVGANGHWQFPLCSRAFVYTHNYYANNFIQLLIRRFLCRISCSAELWRTFATCLCRWTRTSLYGKGTFVYCSIL